MRERVSAALICPVMLPLVSLGASWASSQRRLMMSARQTLICLARSFADSLIIVSCFNLSCFVNFGSFIIRYVAERVQPAARAAEVTLPDQRSTDLNSLAERRSSSCLRFRLLGLGISNIHPGLKQNGTKWDKKGGENW